MKKILISLSMILFVGVVAVGATGAFFSDTETSTGNTFTAGAIDLLIDNTSYLNNVLNQGTTWLEPANLEGHLFFNFSDLKPGDYGEDTISIHVDNNPAYACVDVRLDSDNENNVTEPEDDLSDSGPEGELADHIDFIWWVDDGDNVLEVGENLLPAGPLAPTLSVGGVATVALATPNNGGIFGGALPGATTVFLGKAWCFGDFNISKVIQDGEGQLGTPGQNDSNGPDKRGAGFTCDGSNESNITQSDSMTATISFMAVQARNNENFSCQPHLSGGAQRPTIGALLSLYEQPTRNDCNVNVPGNFATIQGAIDASSGNETICVGDGTFNEDVNIDQDGIRLAGNGASNTTTIQGQGTGEPGALVISADNVIVEGFNVIGSGVSAIRISGAHNNVTVRHNKAVAANGKNAFLANGGQSNHTIFNNVFEGDSSQLVYVVGLASVNVASVNVDFTNNTFGGSGNLALGQEASNSSITQNIFSTVTSFTDVEDWGAGNNYNQNNFNDSDLNLQHSENNNTGNNGITNAENNWWGDVDPSDGDVNANVDVDFDPFEVSAFPEN